MADSKKNTGEYASKLCLCTSFDESFSVFTEQINTLGFKSSLYTYLPSIVLEQHRSHPPIFEVSDTFDQHFLQHYLDDRLDQYDYTIRQIVSGNMATIDWTTTADKKPISKEEKQLFDLASHDYQISNALTIPLLSNQRGIAGASFLTDDDNRFFSLLKKENYDALHASTVLFHNHTMGNAFEFSTFVQPLLGTFSHTEKAVLHHLPKGVPVASIADDIGKSVRYTDNVIRNLRIKFGGLNDEGRPNISTARLIYQLGLMSQGEDLF